MHTYTYAHIHICTHTCTHTCTIHIHICTYAPILTHTTPTHAHTQDVNVDVVKLLVMENIMLQPSADAYILVQSFLDYHVERKKYGKIEVVPMPSDQYTLELTNLTVGRLDRKRSRVTGLVVGDTEVVLQDRSIHTSIHKVDMHTHVRLASILSGIYFCICDGMHCVVLCMGL